MQYIDRKFQKYFDKRTFEGWSDAARSSVEKRFD